MSQKGGYLVTLIFRFEESSHFKSAVIPPYERSVNCTEYMSPSCHAETIRHMKTTRPRRLLGQKLLPSSCFSLGREYYLATYFPPPSNGWKLYHTFRQEIQPLLFRSESLARIIHFQVSSLKLQTLEARRSVFFDDKTIRLTLYLRSSHPAKHK